MSVVGEYVRGYWDHSERVDLVWDQYFKESFKAQARGERGKGIRFRVDADTRLPSNWRGFLRNSDNKVELFNYMSKSLAAMEIPDGRELIATYGRGVICTKEQATDDLEECGEEEADTRLLLHAADAARKGFKRIMIRTVDSDVVAVAASKLDTLNVKLWLAIGKGAIKNTYPLNCLFFRTSKKPIALPVFHAFTGCDTVSAFRNKGKKTARETWKMYDVTRLRRDGCCTRKTI